MMKRYLCKNCGKVSKKKRDCDNCGEPMEREDVSRGLDGSVPFIFAGIAAAVLLISFVTDRFLLTWLAFPLIGAGLIYDHLYEKQVEKALEERI